MWVNIIFCMLKLVCDVSTIKVFLFHEEVSLHLRRSSVCLNGYYHNMTSRLGVK